MYGSDAGTVVNMSDSGEVRVLNEMVLPDKQQAEPVQTSLTVDGWNTRRGVSTILYLDTGCAGPQYIASPARFATELVPIQPTGGPYLTAWFYSRSSERVSAQFRQIVPKRGQGADCAIHDDAHGPGDAVRTDYCYYYDLDFDPAGENDCTICCQPVWGPDPQSGTPGPINTFAAPAHLLSTNPPWQPPFTLKQR